MKKIVISYLLSMCLIFSTFMPIKAMTGGNTDTTGPEFQGVELLTEDVEHLSEGDTFTISTKAVDESPIVSIDVEFYNLTYNRTTSFFGHIETQAQSNLTYNNELNRYELTCKVPHDILKGRWKLKSIQIGDRYGNYSIINIREDISINVPNGITDITGPVITDYKLLTPNGLTLRSGQSFKMSIKATDESQITGASIYFSNDSMNRSTAFSLGVSQQNDGNILQYNSATGEYEATCVIPVQIFKGEWKLSGICFYDSCGNKGLRDNTSTDSIGNRIYEKDIRFHISNGLTDNTPPKLLSCELLTRNGIVLGVADKFKLALKIEDDSEINFVDINLSNSKYNQPNSHSLRLTYNVLTSKYEYTYIIPSSMHVGEWKLASIQISDKYNNKSTYVIKNSTDELIRSIYNQNIHFQVYDDTNYMAINKLEQTTSGSTVTIPLTSKTVISQEIFKKAAEKNIDIVIQGPNNNYSWVIKGNPIKQNVGDIDVGVNLQSNVIPQNVVNTVSNAKEVKQLTLNHDGQFGYDAQLKLNLNSRNKGVYANLFYYNNQSLEYMSSATVLEDGSVSFRFTHASDYLIALSDEPLSQESVKNSDVTVSQEPVKVAALKGTILNMKNGLQYTVTKSSLTQGTVALTGTSKKLKGAIKIPDHITVDSITYQVTAISANALKNQTKLTSIVIGNRVKTIGKHAFYGCISLRKVTLGKAITSIGAKAFYKNKKLKTIIIKSTKLKTVAKNAFEGISKKVSIKVPFKKLRAYQKFWKKKISFQ